MLILEIVMIAAISECDTQMNANRCIGYTLTKMKDLHILLHEIVFISRLCFQSTNFQFSVKSEMMSDA